MSTGPHKPWAVPEEDNMSIGELAEWLADLPKEIQHLPVNITAGEMVFPVNTKRMNISDGERLYSLGAIEARKTFNGFYLEIDTGVGI
jgi:hypothetical protein